MLEDMKFDWKKALRQKFEEWLAKQPDEAPAASETEPNPDIYSFYEQLAILSSESKRSNRRTAEAMSQWSGMLATVQGSLQSLQEAIGEEETRAEKPVDLPSHCLLVAELLDRINRIAKALETVPNTSWWGSQAAWRQAWERQRQAVRIVQGHVLSLLDTLGVDVVGKSESGASPVEANGTFDPQTMVAVEAEENPNYPDHTVLEVLAPGYILGDKLLRPAQVKVSRQPKISNYE
jgi:molecular chaperone GrpE